MEIYTRESCLREKERERERLLINKTLHKYYLTRRQENFFFSFFFFENLKSKQTTQ